ncbi:MAG: PIN domain-containing protein, partial [Myxococcota bacterium]
MYLLDTNVLSELRKDERADRKLVRWFDEVEEVGLFTSVLVIAEIEAGIARKRTSDATQSAHLDTWLELVLERFGARVIH